MAQVKHAEWLGAADRGAFKDALVEAADRLADAAKAGRWEDVFAALDISPWIGANQWRIGGTSLYTPLHQAAWHGAPVDVVSRLIELGAWRSLRTADGERPVDIARARGHHHLLDVLATADPSPDRLDRYAAWDDHLDDLVQERTRPLDPISYRRVPTEIVAAEDIDTLWFPYPGMYGGFSISIHKNRLFVESWCRVVGGSGQAHVITEQGRTLVDEGFV